MASSMTQTELQRLNVTRLRLLCKEKKITGYSKTPKDALIEKLLTWQKSQSASSIVLSSSITCDGDQPARTTDNSISGPKTHTAILEGSSPAHIEALSTTIIRASQNGTRHIVVPYGSTNVTSTTPPTSIKRPGAESGQTYARKMIKVSHTSVQELPSKDMDEDDSASGNLTTANSVPVYRSIREAAAQKSIPCSRPFKPPVFAKKLELPVQEHQVSTTASLSIPEPTTLSFVTTVTMPCTDFPQDSTVSLSPISFPPSVSQRKRVQKLAVALSAISSEDLRNCAQVSKSFRYAAYLSSSYQLSRRFSGQRLDKILQRYSSKITNLWPYLIHREQEVKKKQLAYHSSFLGRAMGKVCAISERLWTSPDDERQVNVAIRFILTKFFFRVSVGSQGSSADANPMSILGAQQITDDIWEITTLSASSIASYYILEGTCEVIGHLPAFQMKPSDGVHLRADWSAYIGARIRKGDNGAVDLRQSPDLLDQLQWTNHEEYDRGVSKLWLSRIQQEGETGRVKLIVAWRYVLACVVGNSISGPWLSSSEMHQEFSGLQSHVSTTRDHRFQRVNLFLPAHHHVESIHFSSSGNRALHPAVAAVQTPGREYFILRDNGMQIGCEEEGIAPVWMKILGCTAVGVHYG